jgi:hypothetical protein
VKRSRQPHLTILFTHTNGTFTHGTLFIESATCPNFVTNT